MAPPSSSTRGGTPSLFAVALIVAVFASGVAMSNPIKGSMTLLVSFLGSMGGSKALSITDIPALAQLMLPEMTVAMPNVPPPSVSNATTIFIPPGMTLESLHDKPFHVHHPDFLDIIGQSPTLTKIADTGKNPLFHEAPVWYEPTDEMFFCQNAGARDAGTGLSLSAVIQKVSLPQAMAVSHLRDAVGQVQVDVVNFEPAVINPNGGTNYKGNMIFAGEGMGDAIAPALYLANPVPPYNTTQLVNNYYGRQFNSVNDVAVNPANGYIYFTDVTYGYLQDFRPPPGLKNQVYRLDAVTKALTVVADEQLNCNGITFSPDGKYAYITETGGAQGFHASFNAAASAGIYRYTVAEDGTFENRKIFAHVTARVADGIHCDTKGNVYAGCGDGVHVFNPSGVRLGTIFTGRTAANFQFAGQGRMVIMGETQLFYATLAATGAAVT